MLHVIYPELPPSSNRIYFRGTSLTAKARQYAERFAQFMAQKHLPEIMKLDPLALYEITLDFYFETVVNSTYKNPKVTPAKQAKDRYKRFDLSNRIKLLEDCIRDALGIDDSYTFELHQRKFHDPLRPRVEIFVNATDPSWYGVPSVEEAWALRSDPPRKVKGLGGPIWDDVRSVGVGGAEPRTKARK